MRDSSERILRAVCLVFALLVVLQLVRAGFQVTQLAGAKIPAVPTLETNENSTAAPASRPNTEITNLPDPASAKFKISDSTNSIAAQKAGETNSVSTNSIVTQIVGGTNLPSTHVVAQITRGTNSVSINSEAVQTATNKNPVAGTNSIAGATTNFPGKHLAPPMVGMPGMEGGAPQLPPEIQARVDKIVNSEIFAPVIHPMPMGLLGIAGETAFLRTDSGQTGLVQPGDSLGDLKLLQIGINRVLVEQDGQKKELTIFNGYGGESLLNNEDEPNK